MQPSTVLGDPSRLSGAASHDPLDPLDRRVLEELVRGAGTGVIATRLHLSRAEVLGRLRALRRSYGTRNNLALAATLARAGHI